MKPIRLGPHDIRVVSDDDTTLELARDGKFGEFDMDSLTIKIRNDVAETVWRETLCHEMVHAVIAMTHLQVRLDDDLQEEVCRSFGPYLAQIGLFSECVNDVHTSEESTCDRCRSRE